MQRRRVERRRARVGLTPLIDVVFILLVFFMLASSFLDWRSISVAGGTTGARPGLEGALLVDLRTDGLRLSGEAMTPEDLSRRIEARLLDRPDQRIVVRPSPEIDVQRTVAVLDRLAAAGARDVTLTGAP